MAILGKFTKQPVEVLDYEFDFSAWLTDRSDTIASQTVTAATDTAGATALTISSISNASGVVHFFAAGGTDGAKYEVTCTITTASSPARVKQAEILIYVKEA